MRPVVSLACLAVLARNVTTNTSVIARESGQSSTP
jgi:hypothetical protein